MRSASVLGVSAVLLLAGATLDDGSARASKARIVRHFTPDDRVSGRYQYVPFDVPPGAARLKVAYDYNRENGENVVDLGLFEPGVLDLGTPAFRGYSGGAKSAVEIMAESATPGYRSGRIPPGRWHVLLGLYKVRAAGVDVTIDIETAPAEPAPGVAEPGDRDVPVHRTSTSQGPTQPHDPGARHVPFSPNFSASARAAHVESGPRWYTGALHTHTIHSDGSVAPADLLRMAGDLGLDFVAITDHNNVTHRRDVAKPHGTNGAPLWIAGEEVTTPNGHASVWGLDDGEWVDFRVRAEDGRIHDLVQSAHRFGALFSINHPVSECVGCGWSHEVPADVDAIEVSNGRHGEVSEALAFWDRLLVEGRRLTAVGSSDWHAAPNPLDVANARVYAASLTENAILAAIRAGHVIVVNGARHATPSVTVRSGTQAATVGSALALDASSTVAVDIRAETLAGGTLVAVANGTRDAPVALDGDGRAHVERHAAPGYIRFELSAADGTLVAVTNPVYLVRQ